MRNFTRLDVFFVLRKDTLSSLFFNRVNLSLGSPPKIIMGLCAYNISKEGPPKSRGNKSTLFSPTSSYTYIFFFATRVTFFALCCHCQDIAYQGWWLALSLLWDLDSYYLFAFFLLIHCWQFGFRHGKIDLIASVWIQNPKFLGVDKSHINHTNANIIPSFLFRFVVLVSPPDFYLLFPSGQLFFCSFCSMQKSRVNLISREQKKSSLIELDSW